MNVPAQTYLRVAVVVAALSAAFRLSIPAGENNSARHPGPTLMITSPRVWNDIDQNGVQNSDETGLPGVRVRLVGLGNNRELCSALTDSTGHCHLQVVGLPGHYQLQFDLPPGYGFTAQNKGLDDTVDSDASSRGLTAPFFNENYLEHVDAGLCRTD